MKRTLEEALHTRARILDSAARTFLRQGLSHASLADIAGVAGVTRGAVYGHFKNKSALFDAMFEHAALPFDPFLIEWHANPPDPLGHLRIELVRLLARALCNGTARRLYSVIYSRCEISADTRDFWKKVHTERRAAEQRIADALADARSQGWLSHADNVAELAIFMHACLMGFFIRSLGEAVPAVPHDTAEHFVDLALLRLLPFGTQD
jgi:TetR/AcrR family transcriptional regulator, acrAB operon repressor